MRRGLACACAGWLLLASMPAAAQAPQRIDGIAAVVNNFMYPLSFVRFVRELRLLDGPERASDGAAAQALVERHLVLEEVTRAFGTPEPTESAVADRRRAWASTLPPGFDVAATLRRYGIPEDDLTAWFREDVRIENYENRLFGASAQPTAAEIAAYVRDHQAELAARGTARTPDALDAAAKLQLARDNQQKRIRDWIDGLVRRADVRINVK